MSRLLATSIGVMMDERAMVELRECETKKMAQQGRLRTFRANHLARLRCGRGTTR